MAAKNKYWSLIVDTGYEILSSRRTVAVCCYSSVFCFFVARIMDLGYYDQCRSTYHCQCSESNKAMKTWMYNSPTHNLDGANKKYVQWRILLENGHLGDGWDMKKTLKWILEKWTGKTGVKRTGSGSCPVVGLSITSIQFSESTIRELFSYLEDCYESHGSYR
jgi:hypothetical protein